VLARDEVRMRSQLTSALPAAAPAPAPAPFAEIDGVPVPVAALSALVAALEDEGAVVEQVRPTESGSPFVAWADAPDAWLDDDTALEHRVVWLRAPRTPLVVRLPDGTEAAVSERDGWVVSVAGGQIPLAAALETAARL
jgi:hypothetical protein